MANPVFGHTSGTFFRNVIFKHGIPEKMKNLPMPSCEISYRGDSFRNFLHLHEGKAHAISHYESVYRITDEGIWQGMTEFEQDITNTEFFINVWLYHDKKYPELILRACIHYKMAEESVKKLDNDALPKEKLIKLLQKQKYFRELLSPILSK